ncbi:acyl-CoA dehydrogenase family protein [Pseudonocardia kunmingensis]|uniref:Acyl-CoA dehydrogenase n=1 Tax=Pseudonocardia kunmingensis TaxID=630975 RepID=A0A543D3L6_9PSEU|nr:acyl-CoA dehydrogenase family protein [Pseudonocardia kunmingensis]TQM03936.1 acyl-CoA dehydrogenase [Pseudonocardia kunmingensis]
MADTELQELAESIFGDAASSDTGFDAPLWSTLEETGLARLTLPAGAGGSEGTFADAAVVLAAAGRHAARVPLVETDLLAGWLLHAAGVDVPAGALTAVAGDLEVDGGRVRGQLARVPWTRAAAALAVLTPTRVVLLAPGTLTITDGANLAEEPRDAVAVDGEAVAVAPAPDGAAGELRVRAALGRAQLLAGAASGALAATVRYAGERVQFGRPIGRFQAVQQQLAEAGAEVAAASAAASAAAGAATADGMAAASTRFAVAAAKARTGEAAGTVARIAHQVHGAIGFTREHDLRLWTTRLWAWRDEDGSDAEWNAEVGAAALAAGPAGLWPLVTGSP